jgi:sarcosine oxidase subunit beta
MDRDVDVVVVGAGVMGGSIALELAKRARCVVVVDKLGAPGHGSTSASSAIVRFNYSTFDGVATSWESKQCWAEWPSHVGVIDDAGMARFQQTGMVVLDTPIAPREKMTPLLFAAGVPYEEWDAATLRERVLGIDTGQYWPPKRIDEAAFFEDATKQLGALFMPDAGFIDDPQLAAHNLISAAKSLGTTTMFNSLVTGVINENNHVAGVRLADGSVIHSPVVVNAAGPWSTQFNQLAGVGSDFNIAVRPMRQEVHYLPAPAGYNEAAQWGPSLADMDLGTYMRPGPGDTIYVGGTEPECDPLDWIDNPDDSNPAVTATTYANQATRAARRLSTLRVPTSPKGVAGVYDVAQDWTPIYDRTELPGFYVAMGTSGNQFKNAPLVGRFLATLIEHIESGHDHDREPLQYVGEHTGNTINLGAFSRRRTYNANSAGNVMG